VLVLESNGEEVGAGRLGSFELSGNDPNTLTAEDGLQGSRSSSAPAASRSPSAHKYRFDSGPSLLLLPEVYEAAFVAGGGSALGTVDSSRNQLDIRLVAGPRYAIHFDDGTRGPSPSPIASRWPGGSVEPSRKPVEPPLLLWGGLEGFDTDCASFQDLEAAAGASRGGEAYAKHMVSCQRLLDGGLPNFIANEFRFKALWQMLGEVVSGNWPLEIQEKLLRKRFKSPKSRAALSFQSLYVGLSPFEAPSVFGLLQPLELGPVPDPNRAEPQPPRQGIYYPVGGFKTVADEMVALARHAGAEVRYHARVEQLLLHGDPGWSETSEGSNGGGAAGAVGGVRVSSYPGASPSLTTSSFESSSSSYDVRCGGVVLNADAAAAEALLLKPTSRASDARSFDTATLSCSVVALHLALNCSLGESLAHHSLFLAVDEGGGGGWDDNKARPLDEPRRRVAWDWQTRFPSGGQDELEAKLRGADTSGYVSHTDLLLFILSAHFTVV